MKYVLLKTDHRKVSIQILVSFVLLTAIPQQWRHSSFGNYYLHSLDDHSTKPIVSPSNPPVVAYAQWAPLGHSIAFVTGNDIHLIPDVK